jgi:hypothetical protein
MNRLSFPMRPALSPRQWFTVAILAAALLLFTLLSAPDNPQNDGSSYSRSPEGYGAWYAEVERSGQDIDRWRKPIAEIDAERQNIGKKSKKTPRTTFIRITAKPTITPINKPWIASGNRLILIGPDQSKTRATAANFFSEQAIPSGFLKIATTRRYLPINTEKNSTREVLVADNHGPLIWKDRLGQGEVIHILPTFLAANAYQNEGQNFAYLKSLTQGDRILMDEYIHGYRDGETAEKEGKGDLFEFFSKTPIALFVLQTLIILGVLIYGKNWRFGKVRTLVPPPVNNSRAYIQALSGILQKANSADFVTETLSTAQLKQLQRSLGLGTSPIPPETLLQTWQEQTGRSITEFQAIFLPAHRHKKLSEAELTQWLTHLQKLQ